jgi:hypothetical protein
MKSIVTKICEAKERARQMPILATELELKKCLTHVLKVPWTHGSFEELLRWLEEDPEIIKRRTIHGRAYTLRKYDEYANDTETDTQELSTTEGGAGAQATC